eukprot:2679833-Rhodomonas_salina.1
MMLTVSEPMRPPRPIIIMPVTRRLRVTGRPGRGSPGHGDGGLGAGAEAAHEITWEAQPPHQVTCRPAGGVTAAPTAGLRVTGRLSGRNRNRDAHWHAGRFKFRANLNLKCSGSLGGGAGSGGGT